MDNAPRKKVTTPFAHVFWFIVAELLGRKTGVASGPTSDVACEVA
jgi:hypothetical protein